MSETFLWHDYETWGVNPALDRPSQFAAIRTDADLNQVGEPVMLYCKPPLDALPHPEACLVTGITPQHAFENGVSEAEFVAAIDELMSVPGTCSVGYNSIRFDDEVTRYSRYRNFYDAYEREWKNGNSRWDIIDVVRLCGAVRPEGIQWPVDEEGNPRYKLELLTEANGIEQKGAHDALVDVRATIDLARLIREKQPRLYDYALSMRNKQAVAKAVGLGSQKPVLHISGMFGSKNYCASVVLPLCMHPVNKNAVICFDLRYDPSDFLKLSVEEIQARVFTPQSQLEDGQRIALKSIHLNKSPMVAPVKMLDETVAQRVNLDMKLLRKHYDALLLDQTAWMKARDVFIEQSFESRTDPDVMLYDGGFFSDQDKAQFKKIRSMSKEQLLGAEFHFQDERLPEMLFRYKGRNFPEALSEQEQLQWEDFRYHRLIDPAKGASICMEEYQLRLEQLFESSHADEKKQQILESLMNWGDLLLG